MDTKIMIDEAKAYIGGRIELLFMLFDEQFAVLKDYKYVDTELIERTWDKHIKFLSYYMGISSESYELLWEFYLDGSIASLKIDNRDSLIEYLAYKKVGRDIGLMCIDEEKAE